MSQPKGAVFSVGYNAWRGRHGLEHMFDALEAEGVTILVDTRSSDDKARYSYEQLTQAASERTGANGHPMRFAARPILSGKPTEGEYTPEGYADYEQLDQRPEAKQVLDGIAQAAHNGERIALLCTCANTCQCHRTRWLSQSLAERDVEVGHLEPGRFDLERYVEEGIEEQYRVTRHSDLPELPHHSYINWRQWLAEARAKPLGRPKEYQSPACDQPIPAQPTQVLIAGSMKANHAQLNYASALVVRAAEVGAQVHVGDNEQGVDARVVETANSIGYTDVVVWTAGGPARNGGVVGGQVRQVPYNPNEPDNGYTQRDRTMIRSLDDVKGVAFFISNGQTHRPTGQLSGTEAGYVFAVEQGKAAKKVDFPSRDQQGVALNPLPTTYTPAPQPTQHEYSLHTLPNAEAGYSTVALHHIRESERSHGVVLEVGRFAHEAQAKAYATGLTEYIHSQAELNLTGSSLEVAQTQQFLAKVAQVNGLAPTEQAALDQAIFQSEHNQAVELLGLAHQVSRFGDLEWR